MSSTALVTPLRELADQLLSSESPRCIWIPGHARANEAFQALLPHGLDVTALAKIGGAFGSGRPEQFESDGLLYTLTPLTAAGERAVFVDVSTGTADSGVGPLASLPKLLRSANPRDPTLRDARRFMELLTETQAALFDGAMLFLSRNRQPFVLVREEGALDAAVPSRAWLRWPLDRLFAGGRACVITLPSGERRGLAVPFTTAHGHRLVVLAPLRARPALSCVELFILETLEAPSLVAPSGAGATPLSGVPRFLWYGPNNDLRTGMAQLFERRDWKLASATSAGEVWHALERGGIDIVLVDGAGAPDPFTLLRTIRNAAGSENVAVVFLGDHPPTAELELLVERWISPAASRDEIFHAVKETVLLIPHRRSQSLRAAVGRAWLPMIESRNCSELAGAIADAAHELGADWCAVHLFDHLGNVYAAHWPHDAPPVLRTAPATFLSGYGVMRSAIDDIFYDEVTDDQNVRARLEALGPISGASIPIAEHGRTIGTLFALSCERQMSDAEFDALAALGESAANAFLEVQTRLQRSQVHMFSDSPHWSHLSIDDCRIDMFRGSSAIACARFAVIGAGRAALVAASAQDAQSSLEAAESVLRQVQMLAADENAPEPGELLAVVRARAHDNWSVFAGIISPDESQIAFASMRYPAPMQIGSLGPVPTLGRSGETRCGIVALRARSAILLCDEAMGSRIDACRLVTLVQQELQRGSGNPLLRVVMDFGEADDVAIAAITKPNFGPER